MEPLLTTDACTLPTAERPIRVSEFERLFDTAVHRVDRIDDHRLRLELRGHDDLVATVRDLTARESQCCSFFTFDIAGTDDDLVLEIVVPEERREILDAVEQRARGAR